MQTPGEAPERLIIINNDESVADPLATYFRQFGYQVWVESSGQEGIRRVAETIPHLILLASALPDQDGVAVFNELRNAPLTGHIPIMFLVSRREAMRQHELLSAGADDVIMQPFDIEILALRMRNAIKRGKREGLTEPRTGLPTGPLIREKVAQLENRQDWYRLDLTIEHFDDFHNSHNFMSSNEALRYAASEICEIVAEVGQESDFVGHPGEAHFIVLTSREHGPAIHAAVEERVNTGLLQFHTFMEREQGYVEVEDAFGGLAHKPLMHLHVEAEDGASGQHDHVA